MALTSTPRRVDGWYRRVCDPSAPAEGGGAGEGGEWGQLAQLLRPFRADPTLLPTWRIYNIVTLRLKYTLKGQ